MIDRDSISRTHEPAMEAVTFMVKTIDYHLSAPIVNRSA